MIKENNIFKIKSDSIEGNKDDIAILSETEREDRAYDAADGFYNLKSEEKIDSLWEEKYDKDSVSFFDDKNLEFLNSLEAGERLNLLAIAATSILVTPQLAEKYFQKFPDDLLAVDKIFSTLRFEELNRRNYHLFTICALQMDKKDLKLENYNNTYEQYTGELEQYYNIARRRKEAPKYLLSNFTDISIKEDMAEFGDAAKGLFAVLEDSKDRNSRLDTSKMFSGEFENLTEEKKALFIRKCLAQFQYYLLFTETYNSLFTEESTDYFSKNIKDQHNVSHSMIFKTFQPGAVFEYNQSYFNQEMDWSTETGGDVEEYADQKMILATLDELKNATADKDKNTKLVVEFWNKNRNPIFTDAVAKVLSEQNVNLAASELLELLKMEKDKKEPINAMLYRLEFGKIGVSEDGVKYLEKVYDLGEYNNSDFHASRLTVNGEIGVFNEELELIKYFHLGKLDSEEKKIKADVLDFTYETLFIGNKKENPEERKKREEYLEEFKKKYYEISGEEIFKSTGTQLNNLSFKEQGWFLIYFNQASSEKKEQLRNFVGKYQEKGIKSFLSLETDQKLGDKIVELGEKLDKDSGRIVFHKISELVDLAEKEKEELREMFLKNGSDLNFDWREVRLALLQKTEIIISNFYQEIDKGFDNEKIINLINDLEKGRSEMLLLSSVLKTAKENGINISLDLIKDLSLESKFINSKRGTILSEDEKKQTRKIVEENYSEIFLKDGEKYNSEAYERIIDDFDREFNNLEGQLVFILKYKDEVICFNKFKQTSNHEVYGASFNVLKEIQGLSIGKNFMQKTEEEVSKNYDIRIKSRKDNPANASYKRSGFEIVGEHTEKDGVEYYEMIKAAKPVLEKAA